MQIDNQMTNYREPRLSYLNYQEVQAMYNRRPARPSDRPCIKPVGMKDGGRFDAKA